MREIINTTDAPAALGPYSQAVRVGDLIYTAGQLGMDPATGDMLEGVTAQAEQALDNLAAVLAAGGAALSDVVKTTIFLADMNDFAAVNAVYGARFACAPPARSAVQVAALPKDGLVEIEMVAFTPAQG